MKKFNSWEITFFVNNQYLIYPILTITLCTKNTNTFIRLKDYLIATIKHHIGEWIFWTTKVVEKINLKNGLLKFMNVYNDSRPVLTHIYMISPAPSEGRIQTCTNLNQSSFSIYLSKAIFYIFINQAHVMSMICIHKYTYAY